MTTNGVPGPRPGHRSRITGATRVVPAPSSVPIVIRGSHAFSTATTEDRVLWMCGERTSGDPPGGPAERRRRPGHGCPDVVGVTAVLTGSGLAIVLAVLGAVCFAGAAVLQHGGRRHRAGSRRDEADRPGTCCRCAGWPRSPAARAGWPGWRWPVAAPLLHAVGAGAGPAVGGAADRRAGRADRGAAQRGAHRPPAGAGACSSGWLLCVVGVAVFVGIAAGTAVSSPPPGGATLIAGLVVAAVVPRWPRSGLERTGWIRCVACATAGAVAFGLVSALVRAVSQEVVVRGRRRCSTWRCWPPWPASGRAVLVGGWLVQQAFASGPPEVVIACLTVVDPIVAVLLGRRAARGGCGHPGRDLAAAGWRRRGRHRGRGRAGPAPPDAAQRRARRPGPDAGAPRRPAASAGSPVNRVRPVTVHRR